MKTITIIFAILLASCSTVKIPTTKQEQERARLREEQKFNRRHTTQPSIRFIHITLFAVASFVIWYEAHDEWRK